MLTKADVFPMYKACKDSKDQGGFHDFVEILKLYDKNDDNTMLAHELFKMLTNLGEKLTKEEAKSLMKDSCLSSPSLRKCALLRSNFLNFSTNSPVTQHQIRNSSLSLYSDFPSSQLKEE